MRKAFPMLAVFLASCSSTGVIPMDNGTYMVGKTSPACGFRSADGTKADLYIEANAFCAEKKKQVSTVKFTGRDGIPFARCASGELQFRCVDEVAN